MFKKVVLGALVCMTSQSCVEDDGGDGSVAAATSGTTSNTVASGSTTATTSEPSSGNGSAAATSSGSPTTPGADTAAPDTTTPAPTTDTTSPATGSTSSNGPNAGGEANGDDDQTAGTMDDVGSDDEAVAVDPSDDLAAMDDTLEPPQGDDAPQADGTDAGTGSGPEEVEGPASAAEATVIPDPSWACGMPEGVPPPEMGVPVFSATLELGDIHEYGTTQYGDRRLLDVVGGEFSGEAVSGEFLTGGLDMELTLSNGSVELEQIIILRTSDGTPILMRTCGFAPAGDSIVRLVPDFEAPNSSGHSWLNDGQFAATRVVDEAAGTIEFNVYDIASVTAPETTVVISDPAGVDHQPWECSTQTGAAGATVFTETVSLGASISIGESKRGNRNIIPITGGTVSGGITGSIVPGGADYQILSGGATLDARYSLVSNDGEYVLIRNCGPFGALVPLFEARADGPYAYLNENNYVSSDPGGAGGGVSITFYERQ